ncbi:MAG: ABC transporter permease [Candidatus Limnocylindria bacterium]
MSAAMLLPMAVVAAALLLAALGPGGGAAVDPALLARPLLPPTVAHPLGTNALGQDLMSQFLAGARPAAVAGVLGAGLSTLLAVGAALLGSAGRRADALARAVSDIVLAVPHLPLLILVVALAGPSLGTIAIALGLLSWPAFARVLRAQTRVELTRGYVEAARALGLSRPRILVRHVAPALAPIAAAKGLLTVQYVVLAQASLAFLGLGDPSIVSWGGTVHDALRYPLVFATPVWSWWLLPPVVAIGLLVSCLALMGTTLDERATPALRALRPR